MRKKRLVSGYPVPEECASVLNDPLIDNIPPETQARYANIMLDTAFKIVFGSAANKSLLIQLLECLIPGKKISSLKYEDKEIPGFFVTEKKTIFDLYCKTDKGERFVVEMQLHEQTHYCDRALFLLPHGYLTGTGPITHYRGHRETQEMSQGTCPQ